MVTSSITSYSKQGGLEISRAKSNSDLKTDDLED
jgi:hypothetical protein